MTTADLPHPIVATMPWEAFGAWNKPPRVFGRAYVVTARCVARCHHVREVIPARVMHMPRAFNAVDLIRDRLEVAVTRRHLDDAMGSGRAA